MTSATDPVPQRRTPAGQPPANGANDAAEGRPSTPRTNALAISPSASITLETLEAAKEAHPIVYELGRTLILHRLEAGREYNKSMLPIAVTATAAYFAALAWLVPRAVTDSGGSIPASNLVLLIGPAVFFILAVFAYSLGLFATFPRRTSAGPRIISWEGPPTHVAVLTEYELSIERRLIWTVLGGFCMTLGVLGALVVVLDVLTTGRSALLAPAITVMMAVLAMVSLAIGLNVGGARRRPGRPVLVVSAIAAAAYAIGGVRDEIAAVVAALATGGSLVVVLLTFLGVTVLAFLFAAPLGYSGHSGPE
jgi:hypothetical protein